MDFAKLLTGTAAAAALTLAAAGASLAWTVPVGTTKVASCTQTGALSNGSLFTISTNVYQLGSLYTYQYDLKNVNDQFGLLGMAADFSAAPDYGTSNMKLFFGNAPNAGGIVYHDGSVGSAVSGTSIENTGSYDYQNHTPTMEAYNGGNGLIVWQLSTPQSCGTSLAANNDTAAQFGNYGDSYGSFGYLYVQTAAKPTANTLYVEDSSGSIGSVQECAGVTPSAVPEPSSVASIGLGGLGVLGLLLRSRKRAARQSA